MLRVKDPTVGEDLVNETSPATDTIITLLLTGISEEVAPPSVQHTNIVPSPENNAIIISPNEVVVPNSRQRLLPPVPSFTVTEMGHGLAHSILSLANADGFENSLVYGKRATWFKVKSCFLWCWWNICKISTYW